MGWIRNWFNDNKKVFIIICISLVSLVGVFFIGRGTVNDGNINDDFRAEIRSVVGNIEQSERDHRLALEKLGEQFEGISEDLGRIEGIEVGIESIADHSSAIEAIVGGLLAGEQRDRDLIIESAILTDRSQRIISDLREEAGSSREE